MTQKTHKIEGWVGQPIIFIASRIKQQLISLEFPINIGMGGENIFKEEEKTTSKVVIYKKIL